MAPGDGAVPAPGFAASELRAPFAEQLPSSRGGANTRDPRAGIAAAGWSLASRFEKRFVPSRRSWG